MQIVHVFSAGSPAPRKRLCGVEEDRAREIAGPRETHPQRSLEWSPRRCSRRRHHGSGTARGLAPDFFRHLASGDTSIFWPSSCKSIDRTIDLLTAHKRWGANAQDHRVRRGMWWFVILGSFVVFIVQ
jgi:hypothetical protein